MNWIMLEAKTKEAGLTNEKISKELQIDPVTYYRKKRGESDFFRGEIQIIRKLLKLTQEEVEKIFFD